jgi:hypothetical protein
VASPCVSGVPSGPCCVAMTSPWGRAEGDGVFDVRADAALGGVGCRLRTGGALALLGVGGFWVGLVSALFWDAVRTWPGCLSVADGGAPGRPRSLVVSVSLGPSCRDSASRDSGRGSSSAFESPARPWVFETAGCTSCRPRDRRREPVAMSRASAPTSGAQKRVTGAAMSGTSRGESLSKVGLAPEKYLGVFPSLSVSPAAARAEERR